MRQRLSKPSPEPSVVAPTSMPEREPLQVRHRTAEESGEFLRLLEGVVARLNGPEERAVEDAVRESLSQVAAFFSAESAEIVSSSGEGSELAAVGAEARATLQVALPGGPLSSASSVVLTTKSERVWTELDRRHFELVAGLILGSLRVGRVEEELRANREWLVLALEGARVGTFDWDIQSDRVRYTAPFVAPGGLPEPKEAVGADWFVHTHPHDVPAARAEVQNAIDGKSESFAFVVRSQRPPYRNGEWIHLYSRGKVLARGEDGRALRIVGVFEDVTEATRKEELERGREAALARAGRQSSLATVASCLAHELNQPLAALTSFVEAAARLLAQGEAGHAEIEQALRRSAALAGRASEIVRRVGRLLKREPPLRESIEFPEALLDLGSHLGHEARLAGVDLTVAAGGPPFRFFGDRLQIELALVNLTRNAIEALAVADGGSGRVVLSAERSGEKLLLRVVDNGPGVPAETAARIFEPYFTTKREGSGLGLAICESIAEGHGGRVRLERTGPEGSCFVLELPISGVEDGDAEA